MSRRSLLLRAVAALVGIVAVALAAATVDSPLGSGGSGGGGSGSGSGTGPGSGPGPRPDESVGSYDPPAFLEYLISILVVLMALAVVWYLITHRREAVKVFATVIVAILVLGALVYAASLVFDPSPGEPMEQPGGMNNTSGGSPGEGEQETQPFTVSPVLVAIAAVAAIFVGAVVLSGRGSSDGQAVGEAVEDDSATDEAAAVGAAAGRAADRIASATDDDDLDNEVYRAWRNMTELLEVERPETSTPGEFATAAVEAGIDREHVDELTRLFEDVRYGHAETTAERESRAVEVLRRIESTYATEGDEGGDGR